jgi:predicted metal-dependent hydrolase
MTDVKVRRIDFQFDDDIPFRFNPHNIGASDWVNAATLVAPEFEGHFIKVIRGVIPQLSGTVRHEADLFCKQEAQHAKHHIAHQALLLNKYPQLEDTRDKIHASYTRLLDEESLEFNLAYAASIELCFGPATRFFIEQREHLFSGGDPRITAFMLWHFVEEFEHRNCAIDVYNAIVGRHAYRVRHFWRTIRHLQNVFEIAAEGLDACTPERVSFRGMLAGLVTGASFSGMTQLLLTLAGTLLPFHNPDNLRQPEWATQWFADEAMGKDMRLVEL